MEPTNESPSQKPETFDMKLIASRINVGDWIQVERRDYADKKWTAEGRYKYDLHMQSFGLAEESPWMDYLMQYLKRAQVLGVDNPLGRQAFGKFVVTALACFESMVRVYGKPPRGGVPSGEVPESP